MAEQPKDAKANSGGFPSVPPRLVKRVKRPQRHSKAEVQVVLRAVPDRRTGERRSKVDRRQLPPEAHLWQEQPDGTYKSKDREWKPDRRQSDRRVGVRDRRETIEKRGTWKPEKYPPAYAPGTQHPGEQLLPVNEAPQSEAAAQASEAVSAPDVAAKPALPTQAELQAEGESMVAGKPQGDVLSVNGEPRPKYSPDWDDWARKQIEATAPGSPERKELAAKLLSGHPRFKTLEPNGPGWGPQLAGFLKEVRKDTASAHPLKPVKAEDLVAEQARDKGPVSILRTAESEPKT